MAVKKNHYEALLAEYSNTEAAIELLKQYRPYLEMIPSMRRSDESLITIPIAQRGASHCQWCASALATRKDIIRLRRG